MTQNSPKLKKLIFKNKPKLPPILANKETKSSAGTSVDNVYESVSEKMLKRTTLSLAISKSSFDDVKSFNKF